jgi:hypothetical protein
MIMATEFQPSASKVDIILIRYTRADNFVNLIVLLYFSKKCGIKARMQ